MGELPLQCLAGPSGDIAEGFSLDQGVETTTGVGYCLATSPGFSFGVIEIDEQPGLADGTERAYRRLFDRLEESDTPHLWRVWQYLPAINADDPETGVERYRLFNQGRAAAFSATGRDVADSAPAACALGCDEAGSGRLIFLAASIPATPIENPRQVSAYHYPPTYGAKSPIFARAALARGPVHDWLFISGTASITGHATRHVGDIHAQLDETLANLEAVRRVANAERPVGFPEFDFDANALIRVYLRHPDDLEPARERLETGLNGCSQIQFLRADICRADLLVEIEATLRQPHRGDGVECAPWIPL
ncbi:hypothetical protein FAZ79_05375 [Guyparkeria sp. SB14A]|uniref:chorismate transformation enzyme, FkbO/Hyg5 family n=1 Tax=Guyparkeria sp. SB14A TaxID=2571147 RepID=UPI0010ABBA55|nr:hypothetical protein [Guyparkeria sp. SB14A]TKA89589.1 hypothetical protein FAZ79_05375 [Guyparkeria sp. SB14A]